MAANLTAQEKETIIIFNQADSEAIVTTYSKGLMRKLRAYASEYEEITCVSDNGEYAEYTIPKKLVAVRKPRNISEDERERLSQRAKLYLHDEGAAAD